MLTQGRFDTTEKVTISLGIADISSLKTAISLAKPFRNSQKKRPFQWSRTVLVSAIFPVVSSSSDTQSNCTPEEHFELHYIRCIIKWAIRFIRQGYRAGGWRNQYTNSLNGFNYLQVADRGTVPVSANLPVKSSLSHA